MKKPYEVEKLDRVYYCVDCKAAFLFHSDTQEHTSAYGHDKYGTIPLE
jgi:hypothetical protein